MRPLLALLLATIILGSLGLFFRFQGGPVPRSTPRAIAKAEGQFDIQVTLTFDAGPDAFALSATDAPSVIIEHLDREILRRTDELAAGETLLIENVEGVTAGDNSFYVRCTAKQESAASRAIRVQVLRDGVPVADQTLWSPAGGAVEGLVKLDVPEVSGVAHDPHDHAAPNEPNEPNGNESS